jgi:hypothetical protein
LNSHTFTSTSSRQKKLEDLITEAKKVNATLIHDQIEALRDADQQLIAQTTEN